MKLTKINQHNAVVCLVVNTPVTGLFAHGQFAQIGPPKLGEVNLG